MARKKEGLTYAAAAAFCGCSVGTLSHAALKSKRIAVHSDGSLNEQSVREWNSSRTTVRRGSRKRSTAASVGGVTRKQAKTTRAEGSTPPLSNGATPSPATGIDMAALAATLAGGGTFPDRASAELVRDSYMARLRQLEYEEKAGRLLDADAVSARIASCCATVRTRLLAIPSEKAPAIARLKSATEVQDALYAVIVEALEELVIEIAGRNVR